MKWRFGIREKFALVAFALVITSAFTLYQNLLPETQALVIEHELVDLQDEAALRSWEIINAADRLREMVGECSHDDSALERLIEVLTSEEDLDETVDPAWKEVIEVRIISKDGSEPVKTRMRNLIIPADNIPNPQNLHLAWDEPEEGPMWEHLDTIRTGFLPSGFVNVRKNPEAGRGPHRPVPMMWGFSRRQSNPEETVAILLPLLHRESSRHVSLLMDREGNWLKHPDLKLMGETPQSMFLEPGSETEKLDLFARAQQFNEEESWTGSNQGIPVQRGKIVKLAPVTGGYFYLEGVASKELVDATQEENPNELTDWTEKRMLPLTQMGIRFGGPNTNSTAFRILARSEEEIENARSEVEKAYRERYPKIEDLVDWYPRIRHQHADIQLNRFFLGLAREEWPEGATEDPPFYFAYTVFRDELAFSVNNEFKKLRNKSAILAGISGLVAFLMAFFFVGPLRRITRSAQRVTGSQSETRELQHQIDEVRRSLPVDKSDEVGDIARALESLLRQVLNGHERLRQLNADLDGKVREQTQELREAMEELRGLAAAKDAFLASVSHELRQPLNSIFGYLQFLEMSDLDDEQASDVEKIRRAADYLHRLINDILDYQKIIMGGMELEPAEFDGEEFFTNLRDSMKPQAAERKNTLEFKGIEEIGTLVNDRNRLQQILINLLSNSCKFTVEGTVTVDVRREPGHEDEEDWLVIDVADTGRGMNDDEMKQLFVKFKKLAAREGNKTGTGLGLVISKGLSELMGGGISCASEFGKGTTFTVRVPYEVTVDIMEEGARKAADEVSTPKPSPGKAAATVKPGAKPHILVIDDDAGVRDLMTRFLEGNGYEVSVASDGESGIALAKEKMPTVITLDVVLPDEDGWTVLSKLKSDPLTRSIPVVMVTFKEEKERGYALGAVDYLVKPVDWDDFSERLRHVLGDNGDPAPVLVVDDDESTRLLFRRTIERDGLEVLEAGDGQEALRILEKQIPSVILLDLMMPVMDGFEFTEEFHQHPEWQDIPILVVTAKDTGPEDRMRLSGCVDDILQKGGANRDRLFDEILSFVRRHTTEEEADGAEEETAEKD